MKPSECGFANPPDDDTPEREIIDRFADFLRAAGPAMTQADIDAGNTRTRTPANRYHLRFLAWRVGQVPMIGAR